MFGRKFVQIAFSVGFVLTLSGCFFAVEDGEGNAYSIAIDGSLDMIGAEVESVNTLRLQAFLAYNEIAIESTLMCRAGGGFTSLMTFARDENDWLPVIDMAENPDTLSLLLKSTCEGEYNSVEGTYTYDLAVVVNNRFAPFLTPLNISCILDYMSAGQNWLTSTDWCLQADIRESTFEWGFKLSPTPVNILKIVLDESTVDQF